MADIDLIQASLSQAKDVLAQFARDETFVGQIHRATGQLVECFQRGGKVLSCGNGGSMCDAIHFAEELSGRYRKNRRPLPALAVSDPGYLSCVANDYGYEFVFSRYVEAFLDKNDILLAVTTSGSSENIVKAVDAAKKKGGFSLVLTGKDGGQVKDMADLAIVVPSQITDRIQEIHIKIIHILIEGVENALFPEND